MGESDDEEQKEQQGGMPLQQASLQQLNAVKQNLEGELKSLVNNQAALREAESRFVSAMETLKSLVPENDGKPMLIPLTTSLYVDGYMTQTKKVTVDVGTGYYIEMSVDKATKFCGRRCKMLADNAARLEKALKEKRKNLENVAMVMQQKMYAQQAAQEAAKEGE
eukprot:CAMPEP_0197649728 /NCGR_PEP_ID=MMETSP1338-20131121/29442_1 /TAXON_ID=43686 ORGANISM="Pelagodinium beii, Strain RCC1491" /NCGR_SAMPLE_ID=MMETSP1338 /ASSEMBLY_ACC=CAM_ASM_000754 /LENGTH=164 /DNA_ID=CAMNT_0043223975 /DNA_START=43 /DNA_END=537 /DNA_ORIENTATION=+